MTLNIDKNVPIPPPKYGSKKGPSKYLTMEVGDSFVSGVKNPRGGAAAASTAFKVAGIPAKFIQRKQPDGTIRVWRVA